VQKVVFINDIFHMRLMCFVGSVLRQQFLRRRQSFDVGRAAIRCGGHGCQTVVVNTKGRGRNRRIRAYCSLEKSIRTCLRVVRNRMIQLPGSVVTYCGVFRQGEMSCYQVSIAPLIRRVVTTEYLEMEGS